MGWLSGLFGGSPWAEQDDQTEIENAIFRNEARGDGDAVPDSWYRAANLGIGTFDEAEEQGTKEGWW